MCYGSKYKIMAQYRIIRKVIRNGGVNYDVQMRKNILFVWKWSGCTRSTLIGAQDGIKRLLSEEIILEQIIEYKPK